jgi:glycosyltransferase involved in cell wall biosynthesis
MPQPTISSSQLVLIPTYNTGAARLIQTVREAANVWCPVWVVADGSTDGSVDALENELGSHDGIRIMRLPENRGKGAAVLSGAREAIEAGFSDILTMDADGQHPADRIADFMKAAAERPGSLVLGKPIFDENAPSERVKGREISNWWARFVTMGAGIGDSLFGFRVYPAKPLVSAMEETRWARRFDFDAEAAIRLCWRGIQPVNIPATVRYLRPEEGGVSHFRYGRDNVLLTWMYTRLVLGFLWRIPRLLAQRKRTG